MSLFYFCLNFIFFSLFFYFLFTFTLFLPLLFSITDFSFASVVVCAVACLQTFCGSSLNAFMTYGFVAERQLCCCRTSEVVICGVDTFPSTFVS